MAQGWQVLYTRPGWEAKVAEVLHRKKIEAWCPLTRLPKQGSEASRTAPVPLFTSFVFAKIEEQQRPVVLATEGVVSLLYWLSRPAVIHEVEIENLKAFVEKYASVRAEKTKVSREEIIRMVRFPAGTKLLNGSGTRLSLPSLGYQVVAVAAPQLIV